MTTTRPQNSIDPGGGTETPPMIKETDVGTTWWCDQISSEVPPPKVQVFKNTLQQALLARYQGHWDPQNIMKGSGYRSITADVHRIDPLLVDACKTAEINLDDFCRLIFKRGTDYIMFINPGEVRIRNGALLTTSASVVWSLHPQPVSFTHHSSVTPSTANGMNGMNTPGGSTIHGVNMHNANVTNHLHTHTSGTLSRSGALFTPSGHMPYVPTTTASQHGSHIGGQGNQVLSAGAPSFGGSTGTSGHLHRNAIHAPAWTPMDQYNRTPKK